MGEEKLQFQKRWEFRMKDGELHSSSDNSRSSFDQPIVNKNNLVPGLVTFEDSETSGTSRLLQEGSTPTIKPGKTLGKTRKKRRRIPNQNDLQEDVLEEAGPKTGSARRSINEKEPAERFFESLFDDLKAATENLFRWMREEMQKVLEDHIGVSTTRRRRRGNREKEPVKRKRSPNLGVKELLKQPGNLQEKKPQNSEFQSSDNLVEVKTDKGKKVPFLDSSQSRTSPTSADQNLQLQTQSEKTVVLAIEAQNSNSEKPASRKEVVDKKIHETSPEQSFITNASFNDKKVGFFLERPNQMLDLNSFRCYYPMLQPEDRSLGCFTTELNSRNILPNFSQISTSSSSMGPGFLVPNHPSVDVGNSLANQVSIMGKNGNTMGLSMNEGAIQFSAGGNYSLLEHLVANHQHGNRHSGYNPQLPDSRLLSYQMPNIREGPHFTK